MEQQLRMVHRPLLLPMRVVHDLLNKPSLNGIPLLVLGDKIDKLGALSKHALIKEMELSHSWPLCEAQRI